MKKLKSKNWMAYLLSLGLALGMLTMQQTKAETFNGINFQVFYNELLPYGDWVQDPIHGPVWLPAVGVDFHPYATDGHWAMTEFGNTWVSYYDWGWAPFHYGRWYYDNFYRSWAWVPGYEWGPAWVSWRTGGGFYGWAPLRPGLSINVSFGIPHAYFVFLPRQRIYEPYAFRYFAPRRQRIRIYNQTTIINNTVVYNNNHYVAGPSRREIQQVTRRNVPVYKTQETGQRGRRLVAQNGTEMNKGRISQSSTARSSRNSNSDVRSSREVSPRSRDLAQPRSSKPVLENQSRSTRSLSKPSRSDASSPRFETKPYSEQNRTSTRTAPSRSAQPATRTQPRVNQRESAPKTSKPAVRSSRSSSKKVESSRSSTSSRKSVARPSSTSSRQKVSPAPSSRSSSTTKSSSSTRSSTSSRKAGSGRGN
ncbi:DUF6600 domain-containing protein [Algoriphagus namhaensis]|uniref:DUF6600 domain-containing protein n=1 Tax=Algoriphagus namhaensis TaxID=915353 RepID=A0ABV8AKU3_9BACT